MNIQQIEALVDDFSQDVLNDFETIQKEFKSITVQEGFKLLERRKMEVKRAEKKEFWETFTYNIELLTLKFRTLLEKQGNKLNKKQKIEQFFNYYDKEIKN